MSPIVRLHSDVKRTKLALIENLAAGHRTMQSTPISNKPGSFSFLLTVNQHFMGGEKDKEYQSYQRA